MAVRSKDLANNNNIIKKTENRGYLVEESICLNLYLLEKLSRKSHFIFLNASEADMALGRKSLTAA